MSQPATAVASRGRPNPGPLRPGGEGWLEQRERGSVFLIALTFRLAAMLGRRCMGPLVNVIALWYRVFDRRTVAASRGWLRRVHGRDPGFWAIFRHIRTFARVTVDRVFLLTGKTKGLAFTRTGDHHLHAQIATGRGAVLLGAHLGSYEAMRASSADERVPIEILGYFKNARRINALLESLNPTEATKVIHLGDDPIGSVVRMREVIERGHLVALLGDRTGLNDRVVRARFLGEEADFPAGPFLLASLLRCPVYLTFGLYSEPNRYDLSCEPFADHLHLPRRDRDAELQRVVQRYADRLEDYCRRAPNNWFNFFDFWRTG